MTNLFSTVSGFFSRALILGAFLPTVIFVTFFIWFVVPYLPADFWLVEQLKTSGTEWQIISITFFSIVVSGLLFNLNDSLIRVYEGYPWRKSWLGQRRIGFYQRKFRKLDGQRKGIRALVREMTRADDNKKREIAKELGRFLEEPAGLSLKKHPFNELMKDCVDGAEENWDVWVKKLRQQRDLFDREFLTNYPGKEGLVLPTVLGNRIRSFEYYPDREYGIDAIALYPRLIAKIDKDYAGIIDDAKTSFDFMINSSFLSFLLAFVLIVTGLLVDILGQSLASQLIWICKIVFFLVLSIFAYKGAIIRVSAWGETVKSAFDLYRSSLLQQLGYLDLPKNKKSERELWKNISVQMIYSDLPEGPGVDYDELAPPPASAPTFVTGAPAGINLTVLKSVEYLENENIYRVSLSIRNEDPENRDAKEIILTDSLSTEMFLKTGSAKISGGGANSKPVKVTGANPYRFEIEDLKHNKEKVVIYEALSINKQTSSKIIF